MPQTVTPYLLYEDATAAVEWLTKAFGFRENNRITLADGTLNHAELDVGDGSIVYLGQPPGEGFRNPKHVGQTSLFYVYVADVDAHYAHAKEAGADDRRGAERPGVRGSPLYGRRSRRPPVVLRDPDYRVERCRRRLSSGSETTPVVGASNAPARRA